MWDKIKWETNKILSNTNDNSNIYQFKQEER